MKTKILAFSTLFLSLMTPFISQARESSTCYVRGYAYNYGNRTYIYSNRTSYTYYGEKCPTFSTHAKNEWHSYFKSEVRRYFKYTIGIYHSCSCYGKHNRARHYIKSRYRDDKSRYRNKDFRILKLRGFDVSNYGVR